MIFLPKDYETLKEIVLGLKEREPLVQELDEWLKLNFSVTLLDIRLKALTTSKRFSHNLSFILENPSNKLSLPKDIVLLEFKKLALKYGFASGQNLENVFVEIVDFCHETRGYLNRKSAQEAQVLFTKKYPMVWNIEPEFASIVVFYFTNKDIAVNENNGLSNIIANDYYLIIKKHDELNYFSKESMRVAFDSKENLDKKYGGSLFFYSRR